MKEKHTCCSCGKSVMSHKHILSRSLGDILLVLIQKVSQDEPFHLQRDFSLTKNQYNNFQKLQYWGLVKKHYSCGEREGGVWELTRSAFEFVNGRQIPRWVKTFNNIVIERSNDLVTMSELSGFYDLPASWSKRAEPIFSNQHQMAFA
jgi:hypothetical protein